MRKREREIESERESQIEEGEDETERTEERRGMRESNKARGQVSGGGYEWPPPTCRITFIPSLL